MCSCENKEETGVKKVEKEGRSDRSHLSAPKGDHFTKGE